MTACVIGGVLSKPETDLVLFKIDWSPLLDMGLGRTVPVIDRIKTSTWAFASDSPQTAGLIVDDGFDETSGASWVTLDGGTEGDVWYIENTVTTTGACINGKNTPSQRMTRQLRIRVGKC